MFDKAEVPASPYDTAWVAMLPSPNFQEAPFFPQCAKWIVNNQLSDGSWGLPHRNPLLVKDALSSTLACILALNKWNIGEEQMNRGLQFIEFNSAFTFDEKQYTPIGFDIIFPTMIEYAKDLNLNVPLRSIDINVMLRKKNQELKRGRMDLYLIHHPPQQLPSITFEILVVFVTFGDAAPTIYPLDWYARLCLVDTLIRSWLLGEEEIFLDGASCAMAFRTLRLNGYDVSSEVFHQFTEEQFDNSLDGYLKDAKAVLELYRASELIYSDEPLLEKQNSWTSHFLKQELFNGSIFADKLCKDISVEVHDALIFPYHVDLERLAAIFNPEVCDARILWTKSAVFATIVDDFFDIGGSKEELRNLIELLEKCDVDGKTNFCSEQVEIIYSALLSTIHEIGTKAFTLQGCDVTSHWLDLFRSAMLEAQWSRNKLVPTLEEYMKNAFVSIGLGPTVLPALYLFGPKLLEEAVRSQECDTLFEAMSTCARLLNDWRGFKRELKEGKLNAVTLQMIHGGGRVTEEDAIKTIKDIIDYKSREMLRLVLQEKNSIIPRACKDLFWEMTRVLHLFYKESEGTSNDTLLPTHLYAKCWQNGLRSMSHPRRLQQTKPFDLAGKKETILDYHGAKFTTDAKANTNTQGLDSTKERIRKMFDKVELSISPYDTAWMAMIPSPNCQEAPFFPQCAKWILENQLNDGSWGLPLRNSLFVKDALSSTLACILALKKWGIGEAQINRGLQFIEFHSALATDEKQHNPIGFDIIFPSMIEYAKDLNLNVPLRSINIDAMITRKNLELKRRCWLMGDEEIFLNCATCALAFRILRLNGYDVSSDVFNQFTEEQFHNSLDGYLMDTRAALELYHASQIIYPDEWILEKQNSWTSHFLKQE
ncbi:hypothetical protein Tsubulata_025937, partial [Turnera subulata]